MWVIEEKNGKKYSLPTKVVDQKQLKKATSPLALRILKILSEKPMYAKQLARKIGMHEQKVYYHIRNLERAGFISMIEKKIVRGANTKVYSTTSSALTLLLKPLEHSPKVFSLNKKHKSFLEPFIEEGKMNATIIIGSPEPHGPTKVRAKDGPAAANLGLFLATFLTYIPKTSVMLDTEVREDDLRNNLILVGGPGVNAIVNRVNKKLPIRFEQVKYQNNYYSGFFSSITNKIYSEESCGIIVKTRNPFDKNKEMLVVAGRRAEGTKAAVLSLMQKLDDVCKGNSKDKKIMAKVVEGIDADSDGVVDSVNILE